MQKDFEHAVNKIVFHKDACALEAMENDGSSELDEGCPKGADTQILNLFQPLIPSTSSNGRIILAN